MNIPFINKDKLTATNLCTSRKLYPFWDLNLFTQAVVYKNRTDQYKICHKQKNAPNRFEFSVFYCNTDSGSCLVVKGVYRWCYWCFQKNFHLLPSQKITKIKHQNHPEWNEIASNEIAIKTVFSTLMSQPLRIVNWLSDFFL